MENTTNEDTNININDVAKITDGTTTEVHEDNGLTESKDDNDTESTEPEEIIAGTETDDESPEDENDISKIFNAKLTQANEQLNEFSKNLSEIAKEDKDPDEDAGTVDLTKEVDDLFIKYHHPDPTAWRRGLIGTDLKKGPFTYQRLVVARTLTIYCARYSEDTRAIRFLFITDGMYKDWQECMETAIENLTKLEEVNMQEVKEITTNEKDINKSHESGVTSKDSTYAEIDHTTDTQVFEEVDDSHDITDDNELTESHDTTDETKVATDESTEDDSFAVGKDTDTDDQE